jgi:elongation factor 3
MSKLVDDPMDASPFLPQLMPALEFAADAMSDPEARKVAENASTQLQRLNKLCDHAKANSKGVDAAHITDLIRAKVASTLIADSDVALVHIANLCCTLMQLRKFEPEDWTEIQTALAVVCGAATATACVTALMPECKDLVKLVPMNDEADDDEDEELCNCTFTLAYGTKILLHNTPMRLKRGHKYGLLGSNDSGKTTLMRSIANGSVEGFPDPATVRTVFVEADILGELSHLSCVDYIMSDPRLAGCSKDEVLAVMATVGFRDDGKAKPNNGVSTLSGGWRMKLALARAMLQRADILLLDEVSDCRKTKTRIQNSQ